MSRRTLTALSAAFSATLVLSACGASDDAEQAGSSPSPEPTTASATPTSAPSPTDDAGDDDSAAGGPAFVTTESSGDGASTGVMVRDIRVGANDGYDRVVIDLEGDAPAWTARYQRDFVQDGSGEPVELRGESGLLLVMQAAGHDQDYNPVYEGEQEIRTGDDFDVLEGLTVTGDFEGQFSIGFALDDQAPYRVFSLSNPSRLVVDFQDS